MLAYYHYIRQHFGLVFQGSPSYFRGTKMILSIVYTLVGILIFYLMGTIKKFILSKPPGRCLSYILSYIKHRKNYECCPVTINCQITKIVINSGSQLSELKSMSQRPQVSLSLSLSRLSKIKNCQNCKKMYKIIQKY